MVQAEVFEEAIGLATRSSSFLSEIERQRKFIIRRQLEPRPCPGCGKKINNFHAAPEYWDGKTSLPDDSFECPYCHTPLLYQVQFFGGAQLWQKREVTPASS